MTITLFFLDKHTETLILPEARRVCRESSGVIIDAVAPDTAIQQQLRAVIDRDTWLIERQRAGKRKGGEVEKR